MTKLVAHSPTAELYCYSDLHPSKAPSFSFCFECCIVSILSFGLCCIIVCSPFQ